MSADPDERFNEICPPVASDLFGGHEFHYESHTDLFRCIRCHAYEVTVRAEDGSLAPCAGQPPAGSGPIEVNML